jgi:hypothetical protein
MGTIGKRNQPHKAEKTPQKIRMSIWGIKHTTPKIKLRHPEPRKRARDCTSARVGVRDLVLLLLEILKEREKMLSLPSHSAGGALRG